jgi:hypothetical protein
MQDLATKKSLFDIVLDTQKILDVILAANGEMTVDVEKAHQELTDNLAQKVDSCAFVEKKLQAEADFFKEQAQYYTKIARALEKSKEAIRQRVKESMITLGYSEISGERSRFTLSKIADKLVIDSEQLPNDYKIFYQDFYPNKEKILDDLRSGVEVAGAKLEDNYALRQFANKKGN